MKHMKQYGGLAAGTATRMVAGRAPKGSASGQDATAAQPKRRALFCVAAAAALAAVGVGVTVGSHASVMHVSGTIKIAMPVGPARASGGGVKLTSYTRPAYVSTATAHAALFIDHASTAAGQTTSCSASNGTGTGCTITWSANLTVPAKHVFSVEIDTGPSILPHNTVLAEGQGSYTVFPGSNPLGTGGNGQPLSLNGVANTYFYNITGCSGSTCSGTVSFADAASYTIFYAGTLTAPQQGQSPTSGNVFDNNGMGASNVTFASDTPSIGTMTGTAQAPWTSVTSNSLNILGVNNSQLWTYQVTCAAGATGHFGLVSGGGSQGSGDVTSTELAGLGTAVFYPAGPAGIDTTNLFTCTNGVASDANGSLVTN